MGGWDILKNYIIFTALKTKSGKGAWRRGMATKKNQASALYSPGPVFDFLSVIAEKITHTLKMRTYFMLEKIITPTPPSKNYGPSPCTQRWSLYEGSQIAWR